MTGETDTKALDDLLRTRLGIFVDANHLFSMFSGEHNQGLETLRVVSEAGRASLLISEITRIEVAKNLAERDCKTLEPVKDKRFRDLVQEMLRVQLPPADIHELYLQAYERYTETVEAATSKDRWECLELGGIHLSDIFAQYGMKHGLFTDETKKHQFADAVVFEQLKRAATADMPVFIFSRDKDFEGVARETEHIELAKTWNELFELLGMNNDVPEAAGLIERNKDVILKAVSEYIDKIGARDGDEFQTNTLEYIRHVDVKPGASIRFKNDILVSGKIIFRAQLPPGCPFLYLRRWEMLGSVERGDTMDTVDAVCEVDLIAHMYDFRHIAGAVIKDGKEILDGHVQLEIGNFGYMITRVDWIVGET